MRCCLSSHSRARATAASVLAVPPYLARSVSFLPCSLPVSANPIGSAAAGLAGRSPENVDSISGTVANEFSIEQTDILAYYEILDNVVSLDLGLNVRLFDMTYMINDDRGTSTSGTVSAPVPMLYGLFPITEIYRMSSSALS